VRHHPSVGSETQTKRKIHTQLAIIAAATKAAAMQLLARATAATVTTATTKVVVAGIAARAKALTTAAVSITATRMHALVVAFYERIPFRD
jgi:hypothetical protein